jgi:hypothetical protein
MKVLVPYYAMFGHIHRMAEAVAEGVQQGYYRREISRLKSM